MRIFSINSVPYGSTARIMFGIAEICEKNNISYMTSTGFSTHPIKEIPKKNVAIGGVLDKGCHMCLSILTGYHGCFSYFVTKRLLKKIEDFKPDIIHLHNLHGWYINLPLLFEFIKKGKFKVVWTLHDCWAFTGHCPHFTLAKCGKWREGCFQCPCYKKYPKSLIDKSQFMWNKKRDWFTGIEDMTIVTPSRWLAGLVKDSFLKCYPVRVINNGIDLKCFKPTDSNFRKLHDIEDKKMILGVSLDWGERKGLDVFIQMRKRLGEKYAIVLIGTNDDIDKKLPESIISIHRTQNEKELAEIYTAADVFANPTREENYPTVNLEAIACGTPVVTFDTGGSSEMIEEETGRIVATDDIDAFEKEIVLVANRHKDYVAKCKKRAKAFDQNIKYCDYIKVYKGEI